MKKLIFPALRLLSLAAAALLAFQAGRASALGPSPGQTFYAVIDQIDGSFLTVTGLEVNDINHRGQFTFSVEENTVLEWRHAPSPCLSWSREIRYPSPTPAGSGSAIPPESMEWFGSSCWMVGSDPASRA